MYQRIEELKQIKATYRLNNMLLSRMIGISLNTLKSVLDKKNIFLSTESALDYFLNNPIKVLDIKKLIEVKTEKGLSFAQLAVEIGVCDKTLFTAVKDPTGVSENTKKLIQNYLDKL